MSSYSIKKYDALNVIVLREYEGKDRDGKPKMQKRNMGFFASVSLAAKFIYELVSISEAEEEIKNASDMVEVTTVAHKEMMEAIEAYADKG